MAVGHGFFWENFNHWLCQVWREGEISLTLSFLVKRHQRRNHSCRSHHNLQIWATWLHLELEPEGSEDSLGTQVCSNHFFGNVQFCREVCFGFDHLVLPGVEATTEELKTEWYPSHLWETESSHVLPGEVFDQPASTSRT